ncbi:hypothetical protein [Nocardioides zhouii]|uniref:Uncharacterized protein n=1 Tax=Nocardioides zhouii TaxID=1168729 RepID=A0A4Q2T8G6_9ACTN|nr:hypothetical protein [Nocardioides zhouii]RYC13364.1 hypothetical protein EUA94_05720 [Nocardioides zhouii]
MDHFSLYADGRESSLTFPCGELPVDDALVAAGVEPNGSFWEGVLHYAGRRLAGRVELDSEGSMFCAIGPARLLERIRTVMTPYVTGAAAVVDLVERARAEGIDLEEWRPPRSLVDRVLGRGRDD